MMVILLMGVAGSGKTTVGRLLASELGWTFHDGDDYHPRANIDKMSQGIPLTDEDRQVWLERLRTLVLKVLADNEGAVVACSALKQSYREKLVVDKDAVRVVYLKGTYDLIRRRLQTRSNHFMKAHMLKSQFASLEEPKDALTVDSGDTPENIVRKVRYALTV